MRIKLNRDCQLLALEWTLGRTTLAACPAIQEFHCHLSLLSAKLEVIISAWRRRKGDPRMVQATTRTYIWTYFMGGGYLRGPLVDARVVQLTMSATNRAGPLGVASEHDRGFEQHLSLHWEGMPL